jgi:hypothetical protein
MKTNLRLTIAAVGFLAFRASAQTTPELDIQMYAGLSITGAVEGVPIFNTHPALNSVDH